MRMLLWAAALLAAVGPARAADPVPASLTVTSGVVDGELGGDRAIWFAPWSDGLGFLLEPPSAERARSVFDGLKAAAESSRTVVIRFDPASGRYDPQRRRVMYRACGVTLETAVFEDNRWCRADPGGAAPTSAERDLALGVALGEAGRSRLALAPLDRSLASIEPDDPRRVLAVRARQATRQNAGVALSASPERDALLVGALEDARGWAALAPDASDARLAEAAALADLGDYDEALEAYGRLARRWPDEAYRVAIRTAAIHRGRGDPRAALAELDRLVAGHGPQRGMKYHYHRGWVLTLLGRDREAVSEFSAGLAEQPDYLWAMARRACSLGRLGRVREAAADQRRAAALAARFYPGDAELGPAGRTDLARLRAVADLLDREAARSPTAPTSAACDGYSDPEAARPRSPLLPPGG